MLDKRDALGDIMAYEDGDMTDEEVVAFFQRLIDSDMVWGLQGSYGRTAARLIEMGRCHSARKRGV